MKTKRERKVDVDKLSDSQLDRIADTIGVKIRQICEQAQKDANDILKIYGLETQLQFLKPYPIGNPPTSRE